MGDIHEIWGTKLNTVVCEHQCDCAHFGAAKLCKGEHALGAMALPGNITAMYSRPYVLNYINIPANAALLQYGAFWMDISTVMHVLCYHTQLEIEKSRGPLVQ